MFLFIEILSLFWSTLSETQTINFRDAWWLTNDQSDTLNKARGRSIFLLDTDQCPHGGGHLRSLRIVLKQIYNCQKVKSIWYCFCFFFVYMMQLLTAIALTWAKSTLWQQQKNPWSWKTEQVQYFPRMHYNWISNQVHTASFFARIFIQGWLAWVRMTDCFKAWKWGGPTVAESETWARNVSLMRLFSLTIVCHDAP